MTAREIIEREKQERTGYLDLGNCGLTELPDLSELTWLKALILSNRWWDWEQQKWVDSKNSGAPNHLKSLPALLPESLTTLICGGDPWNDYWQITDASFLENLTNLTSLGINYTRIADARFLEKLTNLTSLDIRSNQITDASFLEKLTGLTSLYIRFNKITDASFLKRLTNLTSLDLSNNSITDLSPALHLIKKGIPVKWDYLVSNVISVMDNPFETPPVDIVKQGNEAILNYFRQIDEQDGTTPLYEARLFMVGEPKAGKTSLTEKLIDETHQVKPDDPEKKSTLGINIKEDWRFEDHNRPGEAFSAHIWDFGGQEIQYMTHQFFLTPEALYVLVADDRRQHTLFPYWFEVIQLLGKDETHGHSPVLVVLNERNNKSITNFDLNEYRQRYPDTDIRVCEVDLGDTDLLRFHQLREQIQRALCQLPHVGRQLPKMWSRIREDLRIMKKTHNHITLKQFREVCARHQVTRKEDTELISLYLHRLGAILHFQSDRQLRDFIIISPSWALKAIYTVLEDKKVDKNNGFFTEADIDRYWKDLTEAERDKVLSLMKKQNFEICYPVEGGYIAPQLLSATRPKFDWDSTESLKCQYYYRFMLKGIVTRLIVRKHNKLKSQAQVWARGAVFHHAGCDVLVVEEETERDGIIRIEVQGKGRDGIRALDFVRDEIDEIHEKWFSDIDFEPRVPCNCTNCMGTKTPTFFNFKSLIQRIDEGRQTIECERGHVKDVEVRPLLEGVYETAVIEKQLRQRQAEYGNRERFDLHLTVDNREMREQLSRIEHSTGKTEKNTVEILKSQVLQEEYLETLLQFAGRNQATLNGILDKVNALPSPAGELERIDELLEEHFGALMEKLPQTHEIIAAWKEANAKLPEDVDARWKLKFKLPFLFGEFEKELAWDGKAILNHLRSEFIAFAKGEKNWKDLFVE